jgi:hypothetical protein
LGVGSVLLNWQCESGAAKQMPAMTAADMAYREFLCDRVMLAWEASGVSKLRFARSIGISAPLLSNYAAYRSTPSHAVLSAICDNYGIPPGYFFQNGGKSHSANTPLVQRAMELAKARRASKAA